MKIDDRILEELRRYKSINKYITEQGVTPPPPTDETDPLGGSPSGAPGGAASPTGGLGAGAPPTEPTADGTTPPPAGTDTPPTPPDNTPVDLGSDTDVQKISGSGGDTSTDPTSGDSGGELDITDLVNSQKGIEKKQDDYFTNLFGQLETLQSKLGEMNQVLNKLNAIEAKIEKYRVKTPEEKLELRSLDSYPYTQKLSDFFDEKEPEMEKTGKDYVLTTDDVDDINPLEVKKTFNVFNPSEQDKMGLK